MTENQEVERNPLQSALQKFDLTKSLEIIEVLSTEEIINAFSAILAQPGAYQMRGDRSKRNKFYSSLLIFPPLKNQHSEAQSYAQDLNDKIQIIERCFDETRASLPMCDISKYPEDIQLWSHIERASIELKQLQDSGNQVMMEIEKKLKAGELFVMPEITMITLPDGNEVSLEAAYSSIINTLGLILKMLSFEHKLLSDGKLIAPSKVVITEDQVYKAGSIHLYASTWNALEDIANRTLFFGGEITNIENSGIPRDFQPDSFYSNFPNPFVFHRHPSEVEIFDYIANRRLHTWAFQNAIRQYTRPPEERIPVMIKGGSVPSLSSGPFVSEEEGITLLELAEILSFDIFSDQERHHGLTLREWVRGYCTLKLMTAAKQADSRLVTFEKVELEQGFREYKIPEESIHTLIYHLTFGQNSHDLYDSPLIRSQDEKYSLLPDVLITSRLPNVLLSRLSSLETQFEKKGKGFEEKVINFFQSREYNCKTTRFNIDNAQYEYDALLLLEDTLFLIECKNTSISGNHSVQTLRYSKFINDTIKQIKRLEHGLKTRPEIVESLFGRKFSKLTIVPMILNSMPYSRSPLEGVYITDYSALCKFFKESTISEFHWENGEKKTRKVIKRLWSGERPTSEELITYLSMPPQLELVGHNLTYYSYPHPTSENSIFFSGVLEVDEVAMQQAKQEAPAVE